MKAPKSMINAVLNVRPADRKSAATIAEQVFFKYLDRLEKFGDYDSETNQVMAADAAAAEVAFRFA